MTNFSRTIMTAVVAVSLLALLQLSASAQGATPRTLSMTSSHASVSMVGDRGRDARGYGYGGGRQTWRGDDQSRRSDRDDRRYDRDYDRRHRDNDTNWLIGGAILGLLLLSR